MAPRLGGELPPYTTTGTTKPKKPRKAMVSPNFKSTGTPGTSKFVQREPRVSTGMPGTSKFVQRSPRENIGMPSSSKFVRRTK
jgi:hypothetical protein